MIGEGDREGAMPVHRNPMHRDVGLGKLGQAREEVAPGLLGNGHDQVGGSHPIHRLIEAVQPTQDGDRVGSRMNGQVAASRPRLGQMMVAGVHEADDRHAPPGCPVQVMEQLPGVAPGPDQNDPVPRRATDPRRFVRFRMLQGIIHELPPIHRSPSRRGELAGAMDREALRDVHDSCSHPWLPRIHAVLLQFSPSAGPTVRSSKSVFTVGSRILRSRSRDRHEDRGVTASQVQHAADPSGATPRLTVVIVNYNGWPDVSRLVSALEAEPEFRSGRLQVVVVDNASARSDPGTTDGALLLPACGSWSGRITAVSPWASTPAGGWPEAPGCSC